MNKDLENILHSDEAENIASLVNTLCSLTSFTWNTLELSCQDLRLLKSAKKTKVENKLFSTYSLCKFYFFADLVQNNVSNSQLVREFAQHVKNVCRHEILISSFIW